MAAKYKYYINTLEVDGSQIGSKRGKKEVKAKDTNHL